ncbi:MAG: hypothetical protein P0S94_04115 [Simkaniaceae bacterium]|nr:hypothetical protein [Simkaniaceae bacterium]
MDHNFPLLNTTDIDILAHKEAHFGGHFPTMIEYYSAENVGVMPDFSLKRLKELYAFEQKENVNLADETIPDGEKERVSHSKQIYSDLREVYGTKKPNAVATLMSDLILTEDEEATKEIGALVRKGADVVEPLLLLIRSNNFYDPLFPGYGRTPIFAAKVLQKIGDARAIQPLFEALGQENFFTDDAMIEAIASFGEKARKFLHEVLLSEPLGNDNAHAAMVLTSMDDHPETATICLSLLQKEKLPFFAHYLAFACAGLENPKDQKTFQDLASSDRLPADLKSEMKIVINNFS